MGAQFAQAHPFGQARGIEQQLDIEIVHALGGGIGLVGNSDVIIAAEGTKFGLPEVARGALGAATHLSRLVPQHKMRAMVYTSATATAAELHAFGSVLRVVPRDDLRSVAREVASDIAASGSEALQRSFVDAGLQAADAWLGNSGDPFSEPVASFVSALGHVAAQSPTVARDVFNFTQSHDFGYATRGTASFDAVLQIFAAEGTDLRAPLRAGATDEALAAIIAKTWTTRTDRYSEIRSESTQAKPKIEMARIGG